jgi:cytochrome oxidase Cu insertion factor (SCO1/SenC/PrrC family)
MGGPRGGSLRERLGTIPDERGQDGDLVLGQRWQRLSPTVAKRHVLAVALLIVALCGAGAIVGVLTSGSSGSGAHRNATAASSPRTTHARPVGSRGLGALMGVTTIRGKSAPAFSLVDQDGAAVTLASLRGQTVVLTFLDDVCGWLCPVLPDELKDAVADLGATDPRIDFIAVNVNAARDAPSDLAAFSAAHDLSTIPRWFFLTGTASALAKVWKSYGIAVERGEKGAMVYSAAIYFITPDGREAYAVTPYANELANGTGELPASTIKQWGKGIAEFAERTSTEQPS